MTSERIITESGIVLTVNKRIRKQELELSFTTENREPCLLHWGVVRHAQANWEVPPDTFWPEGSHPHDHNAVQTPFVTRESLSMVMFRLNRDPFSSVLEFALYLPRKDQWDNNNGHNYRIHLSTATPSLTPAKALKAISQRKKTVFQRVYSIEDRFQLAVTSTKVRDGHRILFLTDIPGQTILHWGLVRDLTTEWTLPSTVSRPRGTRIFEGKALETPFEISEGLKQLQVTIHMQDSARAFSFVLRDPDTDKWIKDRGHDFYVPLTTPSKGRRPETDTVPADLADAIVQKEMSNQSWTLMHRFNLCHDLLDKIARDDLQAHALIFVWLRYSAIRQLDWQRNYNTQPRELSHAQDRLTSRLARRYVDAFRSRHILRLILPTLGRGGEGQRVRDEILNIMHRHHIKEVSGHFLEEWHQKLHNNTTPDDVVICESYIAFLKSDGNPDIFYDNLERGGVTRKRLESYDRPILSQPDFVPHLKDALIRDFDHFLGILKSVHSGTDLGTAIHAARPWVDHSMHALLDDIWEHRNEGFDGICHLLETITKSRRNLKNSMERPSEGTRDLLLLDIALEDFLRVAVERHLHMKWKQEQLITIIGLMIENRLFTDDDQELQYCMTHWKILQGQNRAGTIWALQAQAVSERLGRFLSASIDRYYALFQPIAEFLGKAFHADSWAVALFTEEVVRGRPAFVLGMLLRRLAPLLRAHAKIGNWQIISRGRATGRVEVAESLEALQGKQYDRSAVIVTDKIVGNEEIPQGVTAIITSDSTDIVSHVAIRARNSQVLIATCYDPKTMAELKSLNGSLITLAADPAGEISFEKAANKDDHAVPQDRAVVIPYSPPDFVAYALSEKDFTATTVGAKSLHLQHLRSTIPKWIHVPASIAIPFGVFERVLAESPNTYMARQYKQLTSAVDAAPHEYTPETLDTLRKTVLALKAPDDLKNSLSAAMKENGIPSAGKWNDDWRCIKQVWASKWNDRAFLSRRTLGIPHQNLFMSVLIQKIVSAEYAFVIHTKNPFSNDDGEIYAEVVVGLGETLVGNYPGRALSFTFHKADAQLRIRSFPSKSVGLFNDGLIFRSDSNGEDLGGYAGAGIYDSVPTRTPQEVILDYATDPLVWDMDFQKIFLTTVADIGNVIEDQMGSSQDIEGVYAKGRYYVVQARPQV